MSLIKVNQVKAKDLDLKLYRKKDSYRVKAIQINQPFEVKTLEGFLPGKRGDYLVVGAAGDKWPVDKRTFERSFVQA